jgi:hypothetical protein
MTVISDLELQPVVGIDGLRKDRFGWIPGLRPE